MEATIILDGIEYILTPKEAVYTPVEREWEILSFRSKVIKDDIWYLKENGLYRIGKHMNGCYTLDNMLNDDFMSVKGGQIEIHSVKRLSDESIWTVGDVIDDGVIESLHIGFAGVRIVFNNGCYTMLKEATKPKPKVIFTTRDGIDITSLDTRIYIINNFFEIYEISAISYTANPLLKYFFNKDNRDEYALLNKPISVTQKEILDYLQANHTKFSDEIITEFFKEKINL